MFAEKVERYGEVEEESKNKNTENRNQLEAKTHSFVG